MTEFITEHWLDIFTTLLGLLYIWLEYRAHIALWLVSIIMPALDIWLYWSHGLYGDAGMAAYYTLAGIYGYAMWRYGTAIKTLFAKGVRMSDAPKNALPITHMPARRYAPVAVAFVAAWAATYLILVEFTNSTVPLLDSFTNALETLLYASFDETHILDLRHYTEKSLKDYISKYRPDIVLCIQNNTFYYTATGNSAVWED